MTTNNQADEIDPIEAMIESGKFDDSTDVTELAAALNGVKLVSAEKADDGEVDETDQEPAKDAAKADETDDDADDKGKPFNKADPMFGVLTGTRKALKEAQAQLAQREQEAEALRRTNEDLLAKVGTPGSADAVQKAANAAGLTDQQGNEIDVATVDIEALRETYDGPIVDAIAALQGWVVKQNSVIKELRAKDASRERTEEGRQADEVQTDIDSVPVLAKWQAGDPVMWNAAIAVEQALLNDPVYQGKSRVERFQEVARRLGGNVEQKQHGVERTAAAIKAAASRATPNSLSELPSGTAPGQSENETLDGLHVTQLAAKMRGMTPAQQEAFIERYG